MKKLILALFVVVVAFAACNEKSDSLIGTWSVEKVNVQFDESRSTPELVKQTGEMEKQNSIVINADSTLVFKSVDGEMRGRVKLADGETLLVGGTVFGRWKAGRIITKTDSPLGEIVVTYCKR